MTLELRYAVRSDVGLLREGNEDSAYAGPRLLAVADGMGGHAAGEVASSLTISAMAKLDSEPPGGDMLAELSSAEMVRELATSPAAWPPIPSATASRRGPAYAESSFPSRRRPTSERTA